MCVVCVAAQQWIGSSLRISFDVILLYKIGSNQVIANFVAVKKLTNPGADWKLHNNKTAADGVHAKKNSAICARRATTLQLHDSVGEREEVKERLAGVEKKEHVSIRGVLERSGECFCHLLSWLMIFRV